MLQSLFRRAQHVIDYSIDAAVRRVVVAVPLIIAGGFLAAALSLRLNRELGAEVGHLVMAALFVVLGAIIALVTSLNHAQPAEPLAAAETGATAEADGADTSLPFSSADRELLLSLATALAPVALPQLSRMLLRNLPILAVIAVVAYILSRPVKAEVAPRPGEG